MASSRVLSPESARYVNNRPAPDIHLQNFAATVIQRHFKGWRVWRWYQQHKLAVAQAREAQQFAEEHAFRVHRASYVIQNAWRGYRNKKIYEYYRDLIQFRERGDPKELLRSINPREGQLADAAAGIHVRFRMGGSVFPPLVFYKIFTHRPVLDIGSFGPRDYAQEVRVLSGEIHNKPTQAQLLELRAQQEQMAAIKSKKKVKHTQAEDFEFDETLREYLKPDGTIGVRTTRGWYDRIENNGWRPISERILVDEDPVTTATKMKKMPFFHFNPAQRRAEKEKRIKQRKREWMLKMYKPPGDSQPGGPNMDNLDLDRLDIDQLDPMADDLLNWSMGLDFENYVGDWTSMACTLGSEAFLPEDESYLPEVPAPSHNFKGAMAAAGVPVAPYKGGVSAATGATSTANLR